MDEVGRSTGSDQFGDGLAGDGAQEDADAVVAGGECDVLPVGYGP